jgi:hypothetical protein
LPTSVRHIPLPIARDIPRGLFRVAVPLYPGAQPLSHFVASPVPEYPASPYLQTGVAEYRTAADVQTVTAWYSSAFSRCGWRAEGTMTTNASILSSGMTFVSTGNHDLTVEMTFGDTSSGGTYIAYAAEEITYPPRPAASYLHGPFHQVRIALRQGTLQNGQPVWHVVRVKLVDQPTIGQLVDDINAIKEHYTASVNCFGGLSRTGPAWLSFVRPNGSVVHAFESGPGVCGGLAVNGVRWLIDPGRVWNLIIRIVRQQQARPLSLPFLRTWRGPGLSPWFRLAGGTYDFSARYHPLGCAQDIALVGTNGYHVADIRNWAPHVPPFKGGATWAGWTLHLVSGTYRIEGRKIPWNCTWSVRLHRTAS